MAQAEAVRLDRWLWHARFVKSRSLAKDLVVNGVVRVNGSRVRKASALVRAGDGISFSLGGTVRAVRVLAPGVRRGPATEAEALYQEVTPLSPS